jgi:hypothetical protein
MPDAEPIYNIRERIKHPDHVSVDDVVELVVKRAQAPRDDRFPTDEFAGTDFPLIHAVLQGRRIAPTPRLISDYARNGRTSHEEVRMLITTISAHRSWENRPYIMQFPHRLDAYPVFERPSVTSGDGRVPRRGFVGRPLSGR